MKKNVKNPLDFMLAQAQLETDIAKEIVDSMRTKNSYYEEKIALKMLDFFKEEEKVITLYVEAKQNYEILANLMENKRPYLKQLLEEAKRLYEKSLLEN